MIVLDWGDTVCDTTNTYNKIRSQISAIFAKHGINITPEDYVRLSFKVRNDLRQELKGNVKRHSTGLHERQIARETGKIITEREAQEIDAEIFDLFLSNLSAKNGVETFLQEAKKANKKIVIISNSNKNRLYAEINKVGFMKYFDKVICSEECGYEKSDLVPYVMALEEAIRNKWIDSISEMLVIGDREEEDGSAKRLGIDVYIINKDAPDAFVELRRRI
ncbi:MAG: HAD family hydrolase [Candidatus Anstonellales archaeon]